jgi:hypothetical protein
MVGFAAHGHLLIGLTNGVVKTWDMQDGGTVETLTAPRRDVDHYEIIRPVLSSSGQLLALPVEDIVELSDAFSGGMTHIVRGGLRQAKPLALSPDDMFIAVAR